MEKPNLNYIQQVAAGDKAFEKSMISVLKKEFPVEVETYKKALSKKNLKETAEIVHKIKHKISILGLIKSYESAELFENNLKNNTTDTHKVFEDILENMYQFINKL